MASNTQNRGNSSSTSSKDLINGVTRNRNESFDRIDTNTIKEMNTVFNGLSRFVSDLSGNLEDFDDIIEKSTKKLMDAKKNIEKSSKEYDSELEEMKKHYFGKNRKMLEEYEKRIERKKQKDLAELEETAISVRKDLIKQSFKNETSHNQIKMLDNKYARKNKFGEINNEYYNQLEKLKTSAIDTFGEGFESNEDYKHALLALQNDFSKQFNDLKKEELMTSYQGLINVGSSVKDGLKTTFEDNQESLRGLLGPLNLFIEPFSNFFGKGLVKIFSGVKKKKPNANDVAKTGAFGMGSLFIVDSLYKIFGKDKKDENKKSKFDKIKSLFGKGASGGALALGLGKKGMLTKLGGILNKGATKAGPVAIAVSILMMAIDAIKGVFKSKEWGASKLSSGIAGAFAGATEGGIKGMFSNMGKWALMGAGIGALVGSPVPVVGNLVGGLIGGLLGAVVGGILGFIGGKKIANVFDKLGAVLKDMFANVWEALKDLFNVNKFIAIFKSDESLGKKIGKSIGLFVVTMFEFVPRLMKKIFSSGTKLVSSVIEKSSKVKDAIGNLGTSLLNGISNGFSKAKDFAKNTWEGVKGFGSDVWEGLKESELADFVKNIFTSLNEGISKFFNENPVGVWVKSSIITPIQKALGTIGDFFGYISDKWDWKHPIDSMTSIFGGFKEDKKTGVSDFSVWQSAKYENVDDAIIRTDGSIIKTNPRDTLVALKDIPSSIDKVRSESNKDLNKNLGTIQGEDLNKKLSVIVDVLSKILAKDVQVALPPQTRSDLDLIMSGGMI